MRDPDTKPRGSPADTAEGSRKTVPHFQIDIAGFLAIHPSYPSDHPRHGAPPRPYGGPGRRSRAGLLSQQVSLVTFGLEAGLRVGAVAERDTGSGPPKRRLRARQGAGP